MHLDWGAFNFEREDSFTDISRVAMSLDLKLELVEVDVLKVEFVLPLNHSVFLWSQLCRLPDPPIMDSMVLEGVASTAHAHFD